jgi:hypothetical protein
MVAKCLKTDFQADIWLKMAIVPFPIGISVLATRTEHPKNNTELVKQDMPATLQPMTAYVAPGLQEETLERAADLLMLRRDTFRIIDGAGPSVDNQGASSERSAQADLIDEGKASQHLLRNLNRRLSTRRWKARSSLPHNRNAPSMGKFPLISGNFRRAALTWLNAPIVPAPAHFLRTREPFTLNLTSGAKRARLQRSHDGSGAK